MGTKAPPGLVSERPLSGSAVRTTYDLLGSRLCKKTAGREVSSRRGVSVVPIMEVGMFQPLW
jgi:hypothetical protein